MCNGGGNPRDGRPMAIAGESFDDGLGMATPSSVRCTSAAAPTLTRRPGRGRRRDRPAPTRWRSSAVDGRELVRVAVTGGRPAVALDVDLTGVRLLELVTESADPSTDPAHVDWAAARIHVRIPRSPLIENRKEIPMHKRWLPAPHPGRRGRPVRGLFRHDPARLTRASRSRSPTGSGLEPRRPPCRRSRRVPQREPEHHRQGCMSSRSHSTGRRCRQARRAAPRPTRSGCSPRTSARTPTGGQLLDITDEIKKENVDLANYPKAVLDLYNQGDGKTYGLPKDFDTNAVWFNKALFDAAGVDYPSTTGPGQDFQETAKKLTNPAAGVWGVAAPIDYQGGYYNSIFQAGGQVISKDGKTSAHRLAARRRGHRSSGPTCRRPARRRRCSSCRTPRPRLSSSRARSRCTSRAPTGPCSSTTTRTIRAKVDVAPLPTGVKQATVTSGIENVGYAGTKHPDEAEEVPASSPAGRRPPTSRPSRAPCSPPIKGTEKTWMDAMPEFTQPAGLHRRQGLRGPAAGSGQRRRVAGAADEVPDAGVGRAGVGG